MADQVTSLNRAQRLRVLWIQSLLAWMPGALMFFRASFTTGFRRIGGDVGDSRLVVAIMEHWVAAFKGDVAWMSPNFFSPAKGALGYSDTFFLNEIFYAPLRGAGLDPFLSYQWTLVLMSLVGFTSFFVLCREFLGVRTVPTMALATIFTFANNLFVKAIHPQMLSVYWLPAALVIVLLGFRSSSRRRSLLCCGGAGLLLGLVMFSTFYIGWFACLALAIVALAMTAMCASAGEFGSVVAAVRRRTAMIGSAAAGFAIPMVPFAALYLPVLRSSGGRTYEEAMSYAPRPGDLLNLSGTNYLWGSFIRRDLEVGRLLNTEVSLAATPAVLVMVLCAGVVAVLVRRREGSRMLARTTLALVFTVAILTLLPIRFGIGSAWRLVWIVAPGATAIRAIGRLEIVVMPVACVAVAIGFRLLEDLDLRPMRRRLVAASAGALLLVAVVEQLNLGDFARVDRTVELRNLLDVPYPPPQCVRFFIIEPNVPAYVSSIDAMLVAERVGVPTVNGYSGGYPAGFQLTDPGAATYFGDVRRWVVLTDAEAGLCSYDFRLRLWAPAPPPN